MPRFARPLPALCALTLLLAPNAASAQIIHRARPDALTQLRDFEAFRSSSNNADLNSNDDSASTPGETAVLADLTGPGVITHMWITVAASEYRGLACYASASTSTAALVPSVDAP